MQQDDGKWRVQFAMLSKYTMETSPEPNNPEVEIVEVRAQNDDIIKFSGFTGSDKVDKKTQELRNWMQSKHLTPTGEPELARYDEPWALPFLRRNEVMIAYEQK